MATPKHWVEYLQGDEKQRITYLPLIDEPSGRTFPGWCTSGPHLGDTPEIEVMCGGRNSKQPTHAAVWRQGHLLHFGFHETPAQLNANGRALLENCIVYIARFTEDRPIGHLRMTNTSPRPRRVLNAVLAYEQATPKSVSGYVAEPWRAALQAMSLADIRKWVDANFEYIFPGPGGKLTVDEDAKALGLRVREVAFLHAAPARLADPDAAPRMLRILSRYVAGGPGPDAGAAAWTDYLRENAPYMCFVEECAARWYLDPLAKARGIPSAELRGPARATRATARRTGG